MKFDEAIPVVDIAALIGAEVIGDPDAVATGLNEIHKVRPGDITFSDVKKYYQKAFKSRASFVIINEKVEAPEGKTLLFVEDPFRAFNTLVRRFSPVRRNLAAISLSATVHPTAFLEPNVVVGDDVVIGAHCHIRANVVIHAGTIIGESVQIHSGTIIGSDAFYYKNRGFHFEKLESCGRVVIGDNVEIGATCTIDRGVSGDTLIGEGTKIDNQVHVGHGAIIGRHCLLAAQVGVSGKCIIGNYVKLWGQVGVAARLHIGDHAEVYAQSGVSHNLEGGKAYFGSPAIEAKEWFSDYRAIKRAPQEIKRIKKSL